MYINKITHSKLSDRKYAQLSKDTDLSAYVKLDYYNFLKEYRISHDLSKASMVKKFAANGYHFSAQYISKIEYTKAKPSYDFIFAFKDTFRDIPVGDVFFPLDDEVPYYLRNF